jgi:hypothetical protein
LIFETDRAQNGVIKLGAFVEAGSEANFLSENLFIGEHPPAETAVQEWSPVDDVQG